jgi:hypothetical protein
MKEIKKFNIRMSKKYFIIIWILSLLFPIIFISCDAAEDEAEQTQVYKDTVIYKYDTVFTKREGKFQPVRYELTIQLGCYNLKENAENLSKKAKELLGREIEIINSGNKFIVVVGKFSEPDRANAYLDFVKSKGINDAFVRNIKEIY